MPVAPPLPSARSQSSEESRALLQRRLGAFFGCTSALLLFFLVSQAATHLPALLRLGTAAEMRTAYLADAALILLCAAIFVACRRAHLNEGTLGTLDVAGFWRPLLALMAHMRMAGFIRQELEAHYLVAEKVADAPDMLRKAWDKAAAQA